MLVTSIVAATLARPEPPVNSYLPPGRGGGNGMGGSPSNQYGPPGFGGSNSLDGGGGVRSQGGFGGNSGGSGGGRPSNSYGAPGK